ncbi:hypothetical protein K438DRAFT_1937033 [Mycena galopus ATCC 62051]|nr:hypothetical protein K438DRAFT_1937033 [Mycena galopus ATCC 62051]
MDLVFTEADALAAMYLQAVKYFDVVAAVILAFDYLLTFELEVSLMWSAKWSMIKVLYFLSRYPAFFDVALLLYYATPVVSIAHCAPLNTGIASGNLFGIAVAEAIFLLRTYALSGRQRKVLIIFGSIYSVCVIASVTMIGIFLRNMIYSAPLLGVPGCNLTGGPFILVGLSFILVLINETVLMAYTLRIKFKSYRHSQSPLIATLFRDGLTYYIFICLGSALNVIVLIAAPPQLREALNTPLRVLHSVLSTRTLLHVREAEREMDRSEMTREPGRPANSSTVHFADEVIVTWR